MDWNRLAIGSAVKEVQLLIICCEHLQNKHLSADCFDLLEFNDVLLVFKFKPRP